MRKFLLFFLAICSFFMANAAITQSADVKYDGILYRVTTTGNINLAQVKSGKECTGDVTIPSKITVNKTSVIVRGILSGAFSGSAITSVVIPSSIKSISDSAFFNCENLKSITVPSSVTSLGNESLNAGDDIDITIQSAYLLKGEKNAICNALNPYIGTLTLDADTVIMDYEQTPKVAAVEIVSVDNLVLGPNVKYVGRMASISRISNLVIGENVTDMSKTYFVEYWNKEMGQDSEVDTVTFAGDVTSDIFGGKGILRGISTDVKTVKFAEGVKTISANIFNNTYRSSSIGITKVILPSTLETLDNGVFKGESHLVDINIPENLKFIGTEVFAGTGISYFKVCGKMETLSSYALKNCTKLKTIIFEEGVQKIDAFALNGCNSINHIEIPSTVTILGTQNKLETKNLTYLKDLTTVINANTCIFPENEECTIVTANEERADLYRSKGYKNVFSMESTKYGKYDVNHDGTVNTKDVKKIYEEILKQ